ncbi:MAG: DUF177 domain-containing protein [Clostridia bacterium]|nr:DUF177 domain-containing protein [Clostridia bacterium]MBR2413675.1 DUF177 domain-containing protein [Clostridia bacterium]MBR3955146.1 DUF177 domain-containing protein [Clostridia bacterium]
MFAELESIFNNDGSVLPIDYSYTVEDDAIATPIHVVGEIFNKTGIVSLKAKAKFDYATQCALCCKPLVRHATVPIHHILLTEMQDEDFDDLYVQVENMRLFVDELVTEDIWLAIPSRFLCKEDCKGLCSQCGADLNEAECGCKKEIDPRLAALQQLLGE